METFKMLLTGGGLVAVGGLISGFLANWLGSRRDQRTHAHEQAMAQEARHRERLAQTYIELPRSVARTSEWVTSLRPLVGPVRSSEPPPPEERRRIQALVTACGSDEVRQLEDEWAEHVAKIIDMHVVMQSLEQSKRPSEQLDDEAMREYAAMPSHKTALWEAEKAIRDRVHQELAGNV